MMVIKYEYIEITPQPLANKTKKKDVFIFVKLKIL
jgi:hypothetical protein